MALPREKREDPVRAYKVASLRSDGRFIPVTMKHTTYGADEVAECVCHHRQHRWDVEQGFSEHRIGACGFYAMKHPWQLYVEPDQVILEVDLFGEVLECEDGYRGMRQRVLRVIARQKCSECSDTAEGFAKTYAGHLVPCCSQCTSELVSMAEMKGLFGTEVCWPEKDAQVSVRRQSVKAIAFWIVRMIVIMAAQVTLLGMHLAGYWVVFITACGLQMVNGWHLGNRMAAVRTSKRMVTWF